MTPAEATAAGFAPVTRPYSPTQQEMLTAAVKQFSGVAILLVETSQGTEIWRRKRELHIVEPEGLSAAEVKPRGRK